MAENLRRRHAEDWRCLDLRRKEYAEYEEKVQASNREFQEEWVHMKLQRCQLGTKAAEIKDAIKAGNQKLVEVW